MALLEKELYDHRLWAVNTEEGFERLVEGTLEDAVAAAGREHGPDSVIVDLYGEREEGSVFPMAANLRQRPNARSLPLVAMREAGLPELSLDEILKKYPLDRAGTPYGPGLEAAHAKILRFFPTRRRHMGKLQAISVWQQPKSAVENLLASNLKIGKPPPVEVKKGMRREPVGTGLSLAPNFIASENEPSLGGATLCLRSTPECRAMCLVYSGMNEADPYNAVLKIAKTRALLSEPEGFIRVLLAAIHDFSCKSRCVGHEPFIRLNIYSDIPWEVFVPSLFGFFDDIQFYDYTKIPGRTVPKNYDLTFSLSGTRRSYEEMQEEVGRGRRVAVVFDVKRREPLPAKFLGLKVIDGDVHDIRPLDPGRVVVGLRWKPPIRAGRSFRGMPGFHTFVVPVTVNEKRVVVAHTPRFTHTPDEDE